MCFFVPEKGHPYPRLAMTGIVTVFKTLAKFGINRIQMNPVSSKKDV
jgi:hypothetical protein